VVGWTWLPLSEAARQLGLSVDAARRRVKSGALTAEKRQTPQGGAWWVLVPPGGAPGGDPPDGVSSCQAPGDGADGVTDEHVAAWPRLVDELRADLAAAQTKLLEVTAAAAAWQGRADVLAAELAAARETIHALEAPRSAESLVAGQESPLSVGVASKDVARFSVPWWHRWWIVLAGGGAMTAIIVAVVLR
jgi:hypothetical protein